METNSTFIDRLLQLIAKDELSAAIAELQALLQGSPAYDQAIVQSARYNGLMKDIRSGTIDSERAAVQKNQLRYALTDMVRELEGKPYYIDSFNAENFDFFVEQLRSGRELPPGLCGKDGGCAQKEVYS